MRIATKKTMALLLAAAMLTGLLAGLLAGCGSSGGEATTTSGDAGAATTTAAATQAQTTAGGETEKQDTDETTTAAEQTQAPADDSTTEATTAAAEQTQAPAGGDAAQAAVGYNIMEHVDADFPVDQYIADQTAKWNLGRKVEFDWYFNYNHHYGLKPWSEYDALKVAADITGIDVTGDIPTGEPREKVTLMMSTNTLPDLITLGYGDPLALDLITGGYIYCLEDLLAEYEPDFLAELPRSLFELNTVEAVDGKMWGISGVTMPEWQFSNKYGLGGYGYTTRKDIWEELGSPSIATPDDLYNTLLAFREKYPTMNGRDSIGITTFAQGIFPVNTIGYSFGVYDVYHNETDNKTYPKYENPGYYDLIMYMNKLNVAGLLDPELFIRDDQSVTDVLINNAFMLPHVFWACDQANTVLRANDPNSVFVTIPPMSATGQPYKAPSGGSRLGAVQTYVTKNCRDLEAAARLFAYGFSPEGTMQTSRGTPGIHYYVNDGIWEVSPEVYEATQTDWGAYTNKTGLWDYYSLWYAPMPQKPTDSEVAVQYNRANTDPYAFDATIYTYNMEPLPDSDEGIAATNLKTLCDREHPRAIMAQSEEEARSILEKMLQDMREINNYDKLVDFLTEQYNKNIEKFGGPKY